MSVIPKYKEYLFLQVHVVDIVVAADVRRSHHFVRGIRLSTIPSIFATNTALFGLGKQRYLGVICCDVILLCAAGWCGSGTSLSALQGWLGLSGCLS